jgi:hypothetical protein
LQQSEILTNLRFLALTFAGLSAGIYTHFTMRRIRDITRLGIAVVLTGGLLVGQQAPAQAESVSAPSLTISQIKLTSSNGQFITLYNATNSTLDIGQFQLAYFNNNDVSKVTSSKLIALAGSVPPHGYSMVPGLKRQPLAR